jgi:hypothetical protein
MQHIGGFADNGDAGRFVTARQFIITPVKTIFT